MKTCVALVDSVISFGPQRLVKDQTIEFPDEVADLLAGMDLVRIVPAQQDEGGFEIPEPLATSFREAIKRSNRSKK